jgi:hypothetical protein
LCTNFALKLCNFFGLILQFLSLFLNTFFSVIFGFFSFLDFIILFFLCLMGLSLVLGNQIILFFEFTFKIFVLIFKIINFFFQFVLVLVFKSFFYLLIQLVFTIQSLNLFIEVSDLCLQAQRARLKALWDYFGSSNHYFVFLTVWSARCLLGLSVVRVGRSRFIPFRGIFSVIILDMLVN